MFVRWWREQTTNKHKNIYEDVCEDICEKICDAMLNYGWNREFCMPKCIEAETERVRRIVDEDDLYGSLKRPFV